MDICSLYPTVNFYDEYPDHPVQIKKDFKDLSKRVRVRVRDRVRDRDRDRARDRVRDYHGKKDGDYNFYFELSSLLS